MTGPPRPGQVIEIPEAHYMYGQGDLKLRVTWVPERLHPQEEWVRLRGVEIRWNGEDGGPRDIFVRVAALPEIVRRNHRPSG